MEAAGPGPSLVTTSLLTVAIVFPIVATGAVILRFYARRAKKQKLASDDWTIILALLMCWAISINTFAAAGLAGIDTTTLDPLSAAKVFLKALWIEGFPLTIGLAVVKISILLFYARIFATRTFRIAAFTFVGILTAWGIAVCVAQLLAANPISGAWNPLANYMRYDYADFALAFAGMSIVFDVLVLCFPLPIIWRLQMPTRRKWQVGGIFWLGAFCCIAASVRFYFLFAEINLASTSAAANRYTYMTAGFSWSHIEPNCSVIAACLPTYGPLFRGNESLKSLVGNVRSYFSLGSSRASGSRDSRGRKLAGSPELVEDVESYPGGFAMKGVRR